MTHQRTAIEWERAYDTALAEHRSVVERARDVLRRCCLDPTDPDWRPLVHEIAKELAAAESAMLKNSLAIIRETFPRGLSQ
jgi:hypothetical protein